MRAALAVLAFGALAACSPPQERPASPPSVASEAAAPVIGPNGLSPVMIGMTTDEANAALDGRLVGDPALDAPNGCRTWNTGEPGGLYYMSQEDRISRISLGEGNEAIRTAEGVGVGSTSADVRTAYPNAVEQGAGYDDPPAHDLVVWTVANESGLRFEINQEGRVWALHAGDDSILYIEGCA